MRVSAFLIFFSTISCASIGYIQCTGLIIKSTVAPVNQTDPRTGLSFQQASAYGNNGLDSSSYQTSVAAAGSIRDSEGYLHPLYRKAQAEGNGWSSGVGSPLTWANTNAQVRPGYYASGSGSAGMQGGEGASSYNSFVNTVDMPLGDGSTLLSNLHSKNNSTKTHPPSNSTESSSQRKEAKNKTKE
ncbi:unnamed protein product [Allacma fusca]|uniref:Uncharacterized protein n=1 Tax=Allacma fusca TaxID=39272 RepID=A0A8J2L3E8_9HEXA|nr:unnamed protein product [Allacma fusca]